MSVPKLMSHMCVCGGGGGGGGGGGEESLAVVSIQSCNLTYSRFERGNLENLWILNRRDLKIPSVLTRHRAIYTHNQHHLKLKKPTTLY